jgi:LEA14-like dessication related protein
MDAKKVLLFTGATLAGATLLRYLYKNVVLAKNWDYSVDSFQWVNISPTSLKFNTYFSIINKSAFKAVVKDIDITVISNGKKLANIVQAGPYDVQADGKTSIFVTVDVMPDKIFTNWRVLLAQLIATKDIELNFVGKMKLQTPFGFITVPIQFSNTGKNLYALYKEYYP